MPDRKHTPDVLGEILGDVAAVEAPEMQPSRVSAEPTRPTGERRAAADAALRPAAAQLRMANSEPRTSSVAPRRWEYRVVSCQNYHGWRPRFVNGEEIPDWSSGPLIHDYLNQVADDSWELAGAGSGHPMYGSTDYHQVYLKRGKQ